MICLADSTQYTTLTDKWTERIAVASRGKNETTLLTTSNSKDPHNAYYRRVDVDEAGFHLLQNNSDNGQAHNSHVQLVPPTELHKQCYVDFTKLVNELRRL